VLAAVMAAVVLLAQPLAPVDVALDPGHSRPDVGAVGRGLRGYQLTLDLAQRVRLRLQDAHLSVRLTRQAELPLTAYTNPNSTDQIPAGQQPRILLRRRQIVAAKDGQLLRLDRTLGMDRQHLLVATVFRRRQILRQMHCPHALFSGDAAAAINAIDACMRFDPLYRDITLHYLAEARVSLGQFDAAVALLKQQKRNVGEYWADYTKAQAAKAAGLQHVIWSTLEDTRKWVPLEDKRMPTLMGKYKVPHFDGKGEADQYFRDLRVPTTFLLTAFYWENLIYFGAGPQRGPDGTLAITFPMDDKKLPGIAVGDIGKAAYGIFKRGREFINQTVAIAGEHLTGAEMARALTQALGQEVKYNNVSPEVYRSLGFPGAEDLGNMFQFKRDFNQYFCGERNLAFSRTLNPELQTFEEWLAVHKDQIPVPAEV